MSKARKYNANQRSMSAQSRNSAIAAIQICWKQMRSDLSDKEDLRAERLAWIAGFLQLARPLRSITDLSDGQMGIVLEEMRRLTGTQPKPKQPDAKLINTNVVQFPTGKKHDVQPTESETVHLAGEEQIYTINKIVGFIGWTDAHFREFLFNKFRRRSPRMLKFKEATALTMILLTIAADKDLRSLGETTVTRTMTTKHISILKKKLQIDR